MKTTITFITIALTHFSSFSAGTNFQEVLDAYMLVKDALVQSDAEAASDNARVLVQRLEAAPPFEKKRELLDETNAIASTLKIEKQRTSFALISEMLWPLIEKAPDLTKTIYQHYCPMKKSYWLSYEITVKNPYYGNKMLSCGTVNDKILN
jgi:hypothetical protein